MDLSGAGGRLIFTGKFGMCRTGFDCWIAVLPVLLVDAQARPGPGAVGDHGDRRCLEMAVGGLGQPAVRARCAKQHVAVGTAGRSVVALLLDFRCACRTVILIMRHAACFTVALAVSLWGTAVTFIADETSAWKNR